MRAVASAVLLFVALMPGGAAGPDDCYYTSHAHVDTGKALPERFYVVLELPNEVADGPTYFIFYQETNGLDGLQRMEPYIIDDMERCREQGYAIEADTVLFNSGTPL